MHELSLSQYSFNANDGMPHQRWFHLTQDSLTVLLHPTCTPPCIPGGALTRPASGIALSRSARAGSLPRSAACAGSAHAALTPQCSCSSHPQAPAMDMHDTPFFKHWGWPRSLPQPHHWLCHALLERGSLRLSISWCSQGAAMDGAETAQYFLQRELHLGLQQRPACPASSSERADSSCAAAISWADGSGSRT